MGPAPKVRDIIDHLETLIKSQSPEEKSVLDVLTELGVPIVSVAVMDAGKTIAKVLGSPRPREATTILGAAKPYDNDTLFQSASISKPITALAVMKLCEQAKLNLDAPISMYLNLEQLSWLSTPKTVGYVSQITLKQLLSHTSGLSTCGFRGYSKAQVPTLEQILRGDPAVGSQPIKLEGFPGQRYEYSGGGFMVVQLILETYLQKPFHQLMEELILKPLEMKRSTFQILPAIEENYAPVFLNGKHKSDPDHFLLPESAAAGLWTTPSDLLLTVQAVQWSLETDNFLDKAWAELMVSEIEDFDTALGWKTNKKSIYFGHRGQNDPGYNCIVTGYKDPEVPPESIREDDEDEDMDHELDTPLIPKDCGICIMTSSALGDNVQQKILHAIPYLKGWPSISDSRVVPFIDRSKVIHEDAKDWCGIWSPGNWKLSGDQEEGMFLQWGGLAPVELLVAAILPRRYKEGSSIDLVADGLDIMVRLGWDDGVRSVEI